MTYEVNGEQYIAVLAGWGGVFPMPPGVLALKTGTEYNRSRLLVFKLGGKATLPPVPPVEAKVLNPPPETANAATVEQGKALYTRFCAQCHGDAAVSGHLVSDLRHSGYLGQRYLVRRGAGRRAEEQRHGELRGRDQSRRSGGDPRLRDPSRARGQGAVLHGGTGEVRAR